MKTKLRKYRVSGEVTISITCIVEASSKQNAKLLALDAPMGTMRDCAGFNHAGDESLWLADELDGEPTVIGVEEAWQP